MSERDTLAVLAEELSMAFEPLKEAIASPENFSAFMLELGWEMSQPPEPIKSLEIPLKAILDIVGSGEVTVSNVASLINSIKLLIKSIDRISSHPDSLFPSSVDANEFKSEFPTQLVQFLIIEYLLDRAPSIGSLLKALGIIRVEEVDTTATRPAHISLELAWQDLAQILDDPFITLKNAYQWDSSSFKADRVLENVGDVFEAFGIEFRFEKLGTAMKEFLTKDAIALDDVHNWALCVPIIEDKVSGLELELGACLFMLPKTTSEEAGLAILPYGSGEFTEKMELGQDLVLQIKAAMDLAGGVGILIKPGQGIELLVDIISSAVSAPVPPSSGSIEITLKTQSSGDSKTTLIGSDTGSRLEFASVSTKAGVRTDLTKDIDTYVEFELKDGGLIIKAADDADSFLSSLLPTDGFSIDFSLMLGFSTGQGFYFSGSGGLEINLPVHAAIGPIEIVSATLAIKASPESIPIDIGATFKGELGPLTTVVENIGLRASFTFPSNRSGNLGPIDLGLGFKPPNGVGLTIDAGVVKGGGYLFFDTDKEEYAGILELTFSEFLSLKAIGLITTRLPDGSKGFSLLIIITVEFGSGIQLGFGFTLLGVGGLLGLNRIVKIEPLKDGIRSGSVESVMFPVDVIANAPRIISDLRLFFPPQQDVFLVGPMAKIGWGTPTLVSAQLGVILEFPSVNITILGVIKVVLPDEKADILRLQVNFIGRFEPSNKLLWFYAELYDSRVLFITLEGGFGLLVNWGDQANFVVSAGGFHPQYNPPPLPFPEPPRIAVNILNESYARIRIEGYFAVTSNSVQFGARAELFFGVSAFNIDGHLGFDVLFQFNPFYFSFSLSVSLSVKVFGIGLFSVGFSGLLEGPTPWHIKGKGSISILFFSISVPFEHTWGNRQDTKLDPIAVYPLIEHEFKALTNWEAQVPESNNLLVSLRQLGAAETDQLVLHPIGKLRISQRKLPLNFRLDKVGNQKPSDYNNFDVDAELSGGSSLSTSKVEEKFAIGQFKNLDGSSKLSSPGFEPLEGGLEVAVSGSQIKTSGGVRRVIRYETNIIDNNFIPYVKTFFKFFVAGYTLLNEFLFSHFLKGSAVAQSVLSKNYKKKFKPYDEVIEVKANEYSVAFSNNNKAYDAAAMQFTSQAKAMEYMQQQVKADATLKNQIHVIPDTELNKAA